MKSKGCQWKLKSYGCIEMSEMKVCQGNLKRQGKTKIPRSKM